MTDARYRAYRRGLACIETLEDPAGGPEAVELLRRSAEDRLLTRGPSHVDQDPLETAAIVLTQLLVAGAIQRAVADAIMEALHEARPARDPAPEHAAALSRSSA